jgi:SHS2 domain-containing protein
MDRRCLHVSSVANGGPFSTRLRDHPGTVYRWVEHTGEVELAIEAHTEADVFAEALAALVDLLGIDDIAEEERAVEAAAPDRPGLLAGWLEELVFLVDAEGFEPVALRELDLGAESLRAVVAGHYGDPSPLVKAVTYHRLAFEPHGPGYRATVVLDV